MGLENPVSRLFNPQGVVVVGASETPGKAAERRTRSLLQGGFPGPVYLINPKRDTLFGRKAFPNIAAIDGPADLAVVIIAGPAIPRAVADLAAKGVRSIIIITAGLGESGPEGQAIEARIMAVARAENLSIVGPNCSGMFSAPARVNLLGIPKINPGRIAVVAQSGNIIDALTHLAFARGVGFSRIISLGNAIGARIHEYLDFLAQDQATDVVLMYLESLREGDALVQAARRATRLKPIVALKVGRSQAGMRASASHTGALAADDRIVEAALDQAGIIRVANVDEMFDLAETFLSCPRPQGRRVAILSEGGGDNSVAADNAERHGLLVPILRPETQRRIKPHLLAGMPAQNPIDYGGTAEENPLVIPNCVREVMADPEVDLVYLTGFFGGFQDIIAPHVGQIELEAARQLVGLVEEYKKPLAVHTAYAEDDLKSLNILKEAGVPVSLNSERVAQRLAALGRQAENARRPEETGLFRPDGKHRPAAEWIIQKARAEKRKNLLETEARELLTAYGVDLPGSGLARDPDMAGELAERIGFPVALKIVCSDIVHKSEVGGVELNLAEAETVCRAAQAILDRASAVAPAERIKGVLVLPMARPGQEVILGFLRDRQFGPVIMFGLGGIFVEALSDVAFAVAPVGPADLDRMVESIKGRKVLSGLRGRPAADLAALKDLLARLSLIGLENPEIAEIDLNPVLVHQEGATVVDVRVILQD